MRDEMTTTATTRPTIQSAVCSNGSQSSSISQRSKHRQCMMMFCRDIVPPIIYTGLILFYCTFSIVSYFAPLLFLPYISQLSFYHSYFLEFKDFHDPTYKATKGDTKIWIEFAVFIFFYFNLGLSYAMTYFTDPGSVPDDPIWAIPIPKHAPSNVQLEFLAMKLVKREETLEKNKNTLTEDILNDSTSTTSMSLSNSISTSEDVPAVYFVNDRTEKNEVRYCHTCHKFKPDRAHHCKFCDRCVLKIDHHCPWIGTCIGFRNYKFFNCMIFYGIACSGYFVYIFRDVIRLLIVQRKEVTVKLVLFIVSYIFIILVWLFLLILFMFHIIITVKNYTTFEYMTVKKKPKDERQLQLQWREVEIEEWRDEAMKEIRCDEVSKWDISPWENWKQVYGGNPLTWFIPCNFGRTNGMWNNGFNFKLNPKFEYEVIKSV